MTAARTRICETGANAETQPPKWTDVFRRSSLGPQIYFVKGSQWVRFPTYGDSLNSECEHWDRVYKTCVRLEVPYREICSSSPVNATGLNQDFAFLDGGVVSRFGNYWVGRKGAWVVGRQTLRLTCYEMGIPQPKRWRGEAKILSHRELIAAAFLQHEEEPEQLRQRLKLLDSDDFSVHPIFRSSEGIGI